MKERLGMRALILMTALCGAFATGCLDASPAAERATGFLDDVTVVGDASDPALAALVPDEVVTLELLPADPSVVLGAPEDPSQWPGFLDAHPEFLAPVDDGAETDAWGSAAGAVPGSDEIGRPPITFDWRRFFSERGRELGAKQGVVLAQAGLIAVAIPSPVPEPTDAAAGVYLAVGTALVLVTVGIHAAQDPAVRQALAQALDLADERVGALATAIAEAIERTLGRANACPPLVPVVGAARRMPGFLPAYRDEVLVCWDGVNFVCDRAVIVAPDDGMLTVGITNVGPRPVGTLGVHPRGVDLSSLNVVPSAIGPGLRESITFTETISKRVLLVAALDAPRGVAIGVE